MCVCEEVEKEVIAEYIARRWTLLMVGWIQFHLLRIFKCLDQRNDISVTEFLENLDLSEQSEIVVVVGEREVGQNDLTKVTNTEYAQSRNILAVLFAQLVPKSTGA